MLIYDIANKRIGCWRLNTKASTFAYSGKPNNGILQFILYIAHSNIKTEKKQRYCGKGKKVKE